MSDPTPTPAPDLLALPSTLRIITLNCWGLKFLSQHRHARLAEIGHQLAIAEPAPSIVALQECWTQEDYRAIRAATQDILPHGKFYYSGIFGGGLAILSKWRIEESWMYRYPLNGRPSAFFRGDWFVGKGVACARIRVGEGRGGVVEVLNTHLHAPYEEWKAGGGTYMCHRVAQAWEVGRCMRHAVERGHVVVGVGDFNMVPGSLAYKVVRARAGVRDVWREVWPEAVGGSAEREGTVVPSAEECLTVHGATCDGVFNTWRWSKERRKELGRGRDFEVDPKTPDAKARRLDYVFLADNAGETECAWDVESVQVGMTMRHPTLRCSLSDHFSVETTLRRRSTTSGIAPAKTVSPLPVEDYDEILAIILRYEAREQRERKVRLARFGLSIFVSIGCFIAVWWSPRNYVAFILLLVSTLGFGGGVIEGLIGGLFVGSELRALREFEYEIKLAKERAMNEEKRHRLE